MPVNVGQTIGEAEYTALRSGINTIMGTPAGSGDTSTGYNQTISAPSVSVGDTITSTQWNALRTDIRKASAHQAGGSNAVALTLTDADTGITKVIHDEYESALSTVTTNRFLLATDQSTLATASNKTKTNWNGVQIHDIELSWASANDFKAFWNAGGSLKVVTSLAYTGSEAKTLDWKNMIDNAPNVVINYTSAFADGGGSGGTITDTGMYDLNTNGSEVQIYQRGGATPYSENDYQIFIRYIANGIRVRIFFRDDDEGDRPNPSPPAPFGPLVDEPVQGTLTTTLYHRRATGVNVEVTAPSVALGSTNTF